MLYCVGEQVAPGDHFGDEAASTSGRERRPTGRVVGIIRRSWRPARLRRQPAARRLRCRSCLCFQLDPHVVFCLPCETPLLSSNIQSHLKGCCAGSAL